MKTSVLTLIGNAKGLLSLERSVFIGDKMQKVWRNIYRVDRDTCTFLGDDTEYLYFAKPLDEGMYTNHNLFLVLRMKHDTLKWQRLEIR